MSPQDQKDVDQLICVEYVSITTILTTFRENLEFHVHAPVELIDQNVAIVLGDIAVYLNIGENKIREILGSNGYAIWRLFHDLNDVDQR